uniref:Bro-N domain-containing protein n=1 Tax=Magnetococcus massalia (strain MO-1) TaxID=451514 RepID=A0A1S7LME4_MAGMO|nr:protein of unknown function [include part of BRO family, N-terminal domain] [Candidatus Magnetococcus massalia]
MRPRSSRRPSGLKGPSSVHTCIPWIGSPWFHAEDICEVLGYGEVSRNVSQHCYGEDTKKVRTLTTGGRQNFRHHHKR